MHKQDTPKSVLISGVPGNALSMSLSLSTPLGYVFFLFHLVLVSIREMAEGFSMPAGARSFYMHVFM